MLESYGAGDVAICGLIVMIVAGAFLSTTRGACEYFELGRSPSRSDKLMIWSIAGMASFLLFMVLMRR